MNMRSILRVNRLAWLLITGVSASLFFAFMNRGSGTNTIYLDHAHLLRKVTLLYGDSVFAQLQLGKELDGIKASAGSNAIPDSVFGLIQFRIDGLPPVRKDSVTKSLEGGKYIPQLETRLSLILERVDTISCLFAHVVQDGKSNENTVLLAFEPPMPWSNYESVELLYSPTVDFRSYLRWPFELKQVQQALIEMN